MAIEILVTGIAEVNAQLAKLVERDQQAAMQALREEAETIMTESKRRVPVKYGTLKGSGFVEPTEDGVRLAYGGAAADYAIYVHENLEANHPGGGEAKYLERPVLEALPGLAERVAKTMIQIREKLNANNARARARKTANATAPKTSGRSSPSGFGL